MEIIKEKRLGIALAVSTDGSIYVLVLLFDSCYSFMSSSMFDDRTRVRRVHVCLEYSRATNIY